MNATTSAKFTGYKANIKLANGETAPCWVMNEKLGHVCKDGEIRDLLKVRIGDRRVVGGWSMGSDRTQIVYRREHVWTHKTTVSR